MFRFYFTMLDLTTYVAREKHLLFLFLNFYISEMINMYIIIIEAASCYTFF